MARRTIGIERDKIARTKIADRARRPPLHQWFYAELGYPGHAGENAGDPGQKHAGKDMNRKGDKSLIVGLDIGTSMSNFGEALDFRGQPFEAAFRQGMIGYDIDSFVADFGLEVPTHLKIDVDGIELPIVRGARKMLADPRLQSVSIELIETDTAQVDAVTRILEEAGFTFVHKKQNAAFATPQPGTFGNLGRNALRGPGFWQVDLMASKDFRFAGGRQGLQFRVELFNVTNQLNYQQPAASLPNGAPGVPFTDTTAGATFESAFSTRPIGSACFSPIVSSAP